jgi:3-oxoacyl-(acyl-carrier-protein) synthase
MLKIFRQKEARKMDRYAQYAMVASELLMLDSILRHSIKTEQE